MWNKGKWSLGNNNFLKPYNKLWTWIITTIWYTWMVSFHLIFLDKERLISSYIPHIHHPKTKPSDDCRPTWEFRREGRWFERLLGEFVGTNPIRSALYPTRYVLWVRRACVNLHRRKWPDAPRASGAPCAYADAPRASGADQLLTNLPQTYKITLQWYS